MWGEGPGRRVYGRGHDCLWGRRKGQSSRSCPLTSGPPAACLPADDYKQSWVRIPTS
jgi:hypothetical protein